MDEQKISSIRVNLEKGPMHEEGKQNGLGLRNVHDRVQTLFGSNYGITLDSIPSLGTSVRIRIPIVKEIDRYAKRITG
ncbi:hypothetical protein D3C77_694730 [compost metagenome]